MHMAVHSIFVYFTKKKTESGSKFDFIFQVLYDMREGLISCQRDFVFQKQNRSFHRPQHLTEKSHDDDAIPIPEGATLICVIRFSWPDQLHKWSLLIRSHTWMVESSLPQKRSRPEMETPAEVKLEFGVGALYVTISWSERMSQSLTDLSSLQVTKFSPPGWKA